MPEHRSLFSPRHVRRLRPLAAAGLLLLGLATVGCRQEMFDQPKFESLEATRLFPDGSSARPLPEHTIPRGHLRADRGFETGLGRDLQLVRRFPMELTPQVVARGRERYDVFCAPCHGATGAGDGMIVRRGFKRPQSYHTDRLRSMPVGYFVNVVSQGFGQMPSYASEIPANDRWAIAAYVRALQLAAAAPVGELDDADLERLAEVGETRLGAPAGTEPGAGEVEELAPSATQLLAPQQLPPTGPELPEETDVPPIEELDDESVPGPRRGEPSDAEAIEPAAEAAEEPEAPPEPSEPTEPTEEVEP